MSRQERQFIVSTDSSGLFGTPAVWKEVWSNAFKHPRFKGFEMIGWGGKFRLWTEYLVREAQKTGCNIVGIHGRIGNEETHDPYKNLKALVGNNLIIDTPFLVKRYGGKLNYILLHAPELETAQAQQFVVDNSHLIRQIYIENHLSASSFGKAVEIAQQLHWNGVNSGIMFDMFHYYNSHDQKSSSINRWEELIYRVRWLLETTHVREDIPLGIHVPVGTNTVDSFPEDITNDMWLDVGMITKDYPEVMLVVENRQSGVNQLMLTKKEIMLQKERNNKILDKFSDCGLI